MKTCTRCNKKLNPTSFHKDSKSNDGLRTSCKNCQNEMRQENRRRKANIEKFRKSKENVNIHEERRKAAAQWLWTS
jgi:hypothetical protein